MLRFRCESSSGPILAMGLSFDNLRLLEEQKPISFDLAPYGSHGTLLIACGDLAAAEALTAAFPDDHVVTLTPSTMAALRRGEAIDVPMSAIDVRGLSRGLLFAGETEHALVEMLRQAKLFTRATKIEGLEEYERHERNAVEDCEPCRERRHAVRELPLRERIYRHPNLLAFAVLAFVVLVTLLVQALR